MKERSIIFRGDGVLAILEGRKIQIRRVIKLPGWSTGNWEDFELDDEGNPMIIARETGCLAAIHCPYGGIGDRLWVREAWAPGNCDNALPRIGDPIIYGADYYGKSLEYPWRSSLFMPRWASRINLEITGVRVERLKDITAEDCLKEGAGDPGDSRLEVWEKFIDLWDSLNARRGYGWDVNPLVWVIEYKVIKNRR